MSTDSGIIEVFRLMKPSAKESFPTYDKKYFFDENKCYETAI